MRAFQAIGCILLAVAASASAEEQFPYTAYVNSDDIYVRSGPGQNYYPTSKLKSGETVEVYRHDPGGWYAIRPPEGSFCWVATRYLQPGRDNIAVVTGDRVVARVGSSFSDIRDVIQVRLERGEEVEVLETKTLEAAQGGERWAKVAPVAGEFRWVLGKFLDRTRPEPTLISRKTGRNAAIESQSEESASAAPGSDAAEGPSAGEANDSPRSAFRPLRSANAGKARPASYETSSSSEPGKFFPADEEQPLAKARPRTSGNTVNEEEFQAQLDQIDLEISQMVAEEPTVWAFEDLRTRAETAVSRAQTALERGRARLVLAKIERFQEIKERFERVAEVKTQSTTREAELTAAIAAQPPAKPAVQPDLSSRFDGAGRLTSVVSLRIGTPHFALVDERGAVRTYVTAAPGVNLRPFVGRSVGITGNRGFMPEFNANHLTARQITVLDQPAMQ
jgi:SH3-like domain-containing protein